MEETLARYWQEIVARPDGPLALRFYLQPLMATLLALRDGRRDARAGKPAYGWAFLSAHDAQERRALWRDGWHSFGKIFLIALALDLIYQLIVLRGLRPIEGLLIAILLAIVPYVLLRGPFNRLFGLNELNGRLRVRSRSRSRGR